MEQKPQILYGSYAGHDIEVRIDEVKPYVELSEIPGGIIDHIFQKLLCTQDGIIDLYVLVADKTPSVRVKGEWRQTIFPENLSRHIEDVRKAALEYIIMSIKPYSVFDWPEENELIEWSPESGGVGEGEISFVAHKNSGNVLVSVYDINNECDKAVTLSDLTIDSLIRIAECVYGEIKTH